MPDPLQNFEGVNNRNGVLPPDTIGDVGPDHYVQWVNLSFAVYDKTGNLLLGPLNGNTLWSGFGAPCEDPQRWRYHRKVRPPGRPLVDEPVRNKRDGGGVQLNSSGRWGDYSMMAVDPTDDCTFWYTHEYYAATSAFNWQTRIGSFKFPTCGGGSGGPNTGSVR